MSHESLADIDREEAALTLVGLLQQYCLLTMNIFLYKSSTGKLKIEDFGLKPLCSLTFY